MLYDYILKNYEKDEPIFLSELPGDSRDYVRQEMKKLVDDGKLVPWQSMKPKTLTIQLNDEQLPILPVEPELSPKAP